MFMTSKCLYTGRHGTRSEGWHFAAFASGRLRCLRDHVFLVRSFRRHLFRCRSFSAHTVSVPIQCSLTVHLFRVRVWVSHRAPNWRRKGPRRKFEDPLTLKLGQPFFNNFVYVELSNRWRRLRPVATFHKLSMTSHFGYFASHRVLCERTFTLKYMNLWMLQRASRQGLREGSSGGTSYPGLGGPGRRGPGRVQVPALSFLAFFFWSSSNFGTKFQ